MNSYISIIVDSFLRPQFFTIFVIAIISLIAALDNIAFSSEVDDFDLVIFSKRFLGSIISYIFMLLLSCIPSISPVINIGLTITGLFLIREFSVAFKWRGVDLTGLTIFINIAIEYLKLKSKKAVQAFCFKIRDMSEEKPSGL